MCLFGPDEQCKQLSDDELAETGEVGLPWGRYKTPDGVDRADRTPVICAICWSLSIDHLYNLGSSPA